MENVENRTASAILQKPLSVVIGGESYTAAPPTLATLILASEAIACMPVINLNTERVASESLSVAKDCRVMGDVLAILILGARGLTETIKVEKRRFFGLKKEVTESIIDHKAVLAKKILEEVSPQLYNELFSQLLGTMEVAFFFAISTSLIEINLLHQTKTEEAEEMIVSGR
jgi:hypothetical protein